MENYGIKYAIYGIKLQNIEIFYHWRGGRF